MLHLEQGGRRSVPPADDVRQLILSPLDATSWRLCDRSVASSHAASLVAYVEQLGPSLYEVVWVSVGAGAQRFRSIDEVFRAAVGLLDEATARVVGKPVPIPHRRPLAPL